MPEILGEIDEKTEKSPGFGVFNPSFDSFLDDGIHEFLHGHLFLSIHKSKSVVISLSIVFSMNNESKTAAATANSWLAKKETSQD